MIKRIKNRLFKKDYFCAPEVRINNVNFDHKCNIAYGADLADTVIGKFSSIGRNTTIRKALIGNFCSVSYNVSIGAASHPMDRVSGSAAFFQPKFGLCNNKESIIHEETIVGHGVWIGCNAVILEGARIGNGAIIGAGAVVTKDVEPYSVVIGVPAKHIRYRFNENIIEHLEKSRWWTMNDEFYRKNLSLFSATLDLRISESLEKKCEEYNENSNIIRSV